jgi:hypothetical protein
MKIMFDSLSTQVLYQKKPTVVPPNAGDYPTATHKRINTLHGAIKGAGVSSADPWHVSYSSYPITTLQLSDVNVYISMTRYFTEPFAYQAGELAALQGFVSGGGGLLLLSNHGPFKSNPTSWPVNDIALAAQFGITLQAIGVSQNNYMPMTMDQAPPYIANQIQGIAAHDSCIIVPPTSFTSIAQFPPGATAWDPVAKKNVPPSSPYFSILVPFGKGNVIVVGNSGMFADYGTPQPNAINLRKSTYFAIDII